MCSGKIEFYAELEFVSCLFNVSFPARYEDSPESCNGFFHCEILCQQVVNFHMYALYVFHDLLDYPVKVVQRPRIPHGGSCVSVKTVFQGKTKEVAAFL